MSRVDTHYDDQYNKVNFVSDEDGRTGYVSGLEHPQDRPKVRRFIIDGDGYRVGETVWVDGELESERWYAQKSRGRGPTKIVEGMGMRVTYLDD